MSIFGKTKLGLALGSGGGKGLVHIGIIKELLSLGIKLDYISGTSIGALVGGLYAATQDIKILEDLALNIKDSKLNLLGDLSSNTGLIKGSSVIDLLEKYIKGIKIEDLPIKFSTVATDIEKGEIVYIESGDLIQAIRASISVPLFFDPVTFKDRLLVDGGTMEPVPINAVKRLGANNVIAVNLDHHSFPIRGGVKKNILKSKTVMAQAVIDLMIHELAEKDCKEADITLTPDINTKGLIGLGNVNDASRYIRLGQKVVQARKSKIQKLAG